MTWFAAVSNWLSQKSTLVWWLSAGSLSLFLLTPLCVAWLITRLPVDYFSRSSPHALASWDERSSLRLVLLAARSAFGIVLIVAGIVMLIAPGQGLLTIVMGLILTEFPGKYRLERSLAKRRHVWRAINWVRKRAGRPELAFPA